MLRRRCHKKIKIIGKTKRRKKKNETNWKCQCSTRGFFDVDESVKERAEKEQLKFFIKKTEFYQIDKIARSEFLFLTRSCIV